MSHDESSSAASSLLRIESAKDDVLIGADGREYVDFVTGYGAVLLGHGRRAVRDRVHGQLDLLWSTARCTAPVVEEAAELMDSRFRPSHRWLQFCISGNEAIEFAIRIAAIATGRKAFIGFSRSMHGKSIAASSLCWGSQFVNVQNLVTLPFVDSCPEHEILDRLEKALVSVPTAGVFIEPIQGSSGAHEASPEFYLAAAELCRSHGSLCIVDEVLTGFYRAGALSYSLEIGLSPDLLIFGKAMGNGFPIAAVVCSEAIEVTRAMLPGSTFSNNPLAAAAATATLHEMARIDVGTKVAAIDEQIRHAFSQLGTERVTLRGKGALWAVELPSEESALEVKRAAEAAGVLLTAHDSFVRLFPTATSPRDRLSRSLSIVGDACLDALE